MLTLIFQLYQQAEYYKKNNFNYDLCTCGFANISSVAIQIGGIGAMAPNKKGTIAKLGFKALLGGALATCLTATIAGILF